MHYYCLVVDDEKALAEATAEYFNIFDVKTHYVLTGGDCISFLSNGRRD